MINRIVEYIGIAVGWFYRKVTKRGVEGVEGVEVLKGDFTEEIAPLCRTAH